MRRPQRQLGVTAIVALILAGGCGTSSSRSASDACPVQPPTLDATTVVEASSVDSTAGDERNDAKSDSAKADAQVPCAPPAPSTGCGDGVCESAMGETCTSCDADCGPCCVANSACNAAQCSEPGSTTCCTAPPAMSQGQQYGGMTYANWDFGVNSLSEISHRLCFVNDPGGSAGIFFQTYDGGIDGTGAYHGLQTGTQIGRNTIMSRFGTTDTSNVRTGTGGIVNMGTNEGPFVNVMQPYPFGIGCYVVSVARAEFDGTGDWFDMNVTRECDGIKTYAGGIRFPRATANTPASFVNNGGSWVEAFTPQTDISAIPYSHITLKASANNGVAAVHATGAPNDVIFSDTFRVNCDVYYDAATGLVNMESGQFTPRCHPPMPPNDALF